MSKNEITPPPGCQAEFTVRRGAIIIDGKPVEHIIGGMVCPAAAECGEQVLVDEPLVEKMSFTSRMLDRRRARQHVAKVASQVAVSSCASCPGRQAALEAAVAADPVDYPGCPAE